MTPPGSEALPPSGRRAFFRLDGVAVPDRTAGSAGFQADRIDWRHNGRLRRSTHRAMPKVRQHAVSLGGTADEIESLFYEALKQGDVAMLMDCWADEDEILCIHPGGARLVGHGQVRSAFEMMLSQGPLRIRVEQLRRIEAMGSAVHSVLECVELPTPRGPMEVWVMATNVYHKTARGWRLVAHHASPGSPPEERSDGATATPSTFLH